MCWKNSFGKLLYSVMAGFDSLCGREVLNESLDLRSIVLYTLVVRLGIVRKVDILFNHLTPNSLQTPTNQPHVQFIKSTFYVMIPGRLKFGFIDPK